MKEESRNSLVDLFYNIFLPAIFMTWLDDWTGCSPALALGVALLFPLSFGVMEFWKKKRCNFFSTIGFLNVLLTGGIGLWQLPKDWIAVKEAIIPIILGLFVLASLKTSRPFFQIILTQRFIFNQAIIDRTMSDERSRPILHRLVVRGTWMLFFTFLLSAVLNFVLAKYFIRSETGTASFNKEMGRLLVCGHIGIILPCMAILIMAFGYVANGICRIAGCRLVDLFDDKTL
jgi:intracellular septation protein A